MAQIQFLDDRFHPVQNIFCIGRNYAAHAAELGNRTEETPVVFLKPTGALLAEGEPLRLPAHSQNVQHEIELVVLIGAGGRHIPEAQALQHVAGYGLGLDLTARDIQTINKEKGLPWTSAKGFAGAAPISRFLPAAACPAPTRMAFQLHVNGALRQQGDTRQMLFPVANLLAYLSTVFGLQAGDLVFTGTPAGVAQLQPGDQVHLEGLDGLSALQANFRVAAAEV